MSTDMQKRAGPWLRMHLGNWYRSAGNEIDAAIIMNTEKGKVALIWRGDDVDLEEVFCGPVDSPSHAAKEAADKALLKDGWLLDSQEGFKATIDVVNSLGVQIGTMGPPLGKEQP
jgi:hypothetical protein